MLQSVFTAASASSQWLADPRVFAVNRLPAHSNHRFFDHEPADGERMQLQQSLDGRWQVRSMETRRS